ADLRNIALVGHGGSGKTTLTERLLFATKTIGRMGTVEEGTTASDYTEEERQHKHSLVAGLVNFGFDGRRINLVDTPGLADFIGHAIAIFPAVETVAVVVDAVRGIETGTRRLMNAAADRGVPRMLIINKMDHPEARLPELVEKLRSVFGPICLPVNLPVEGGQRVTNVFDHDGYDAAGDQADFSSVHEAHRAIIEQVVEVDEELMGEYLEHGDKLDPGKLHDVFERALREAHLIPVCFCSARTGAGIEDLLHVMAHLCPSPLEGNPPRFIKREMDGTEHPVEVRPDPAGKVLAHVFKVTVDPFVGKLGLFRVHQGTVRAKTELFINDQKKALRIGHLFRPQGKEHLEVHEVGPGDIAAVSKIDEVHFGGVLHDSHELDGVRIEPVPLPAPMYGLAVELKNHADEAKFSGAVHKLMEEDPCFRMERIAATKQTVLRGMGDLHLRVMLEKLKHNSNIEVTTSQPKIAYKETITARGEGHHRHKKQTGGAGQFGEVYLRVEPLPKDHPEGFEFVNETVGGSIPKQFMPAIEKGVRQALVEGAVAGYPMTGVRVAVYDGKYHAVDSKEVAFVTAGRKAFIDGVNKARPALLEPIVMLEISAPARSMGDITGDLSGRRGRVLASEMTDGDSCVIRAEAPLSELQNYANELKSMTGGTASYTMEYSHDEQTPAHVQQEVVAAFKPREED
ncbi:MAG TPA: elongation factor G, partial [Phycisphaerales bacterium]|nr:elongation factor G [Phycisphaerales bacterium]